MNVGVGGGSSDTTRPTVTITVPTGTGSYTAASSPLRVEGTAADNVGVTQVTWANDRGGTGTADGTLSWTASAIALQPGTNVVTVTAADAAGNTGTSKLTVTYTAQDTTPPTVAITSPAASANVAGTVRVSATAADNIGLSSVRFFADGAGLGLPVPAPGPYSVLWNATGAAPGSHVLTAVAADTAGNTASSTPVTVTVPAPSPTVMQQGLWSGPFDWSPLVAVHMTLTPTGAVLIWDG